MEAGTMDFRLEYSGSLSAHVLEVNRGQSNPAATSDPAPNCDAAQGSDPDALASRADPTAHAPRSKQHSASTWERFRPLIEKLYIDEELRLSDVSEVMAQRHGFSATIAMYKKAFRRWNIRKNYSLQQKRDVLAEIFEAEPSEGKNLTGLTVNGKPLKASRVIRSVQKNGRAMTIVPGSPVTRQILQQTSNGTQPLVSRLDELKYPCRGPQAPLGDGGVERVTLSVQRYYSWYSSQYEIATMYSFPGELLGAINLLIEAKAHLRSHLPDAFKRLDKFCSLFQPLLKSQPFQLLPELVSEFVKEEWQTHQQLRNSLLRFLATLTSQILGILHPIYTIILSLAKGGCRAGVSNFYTVMLDTTSPGMTVRSEQYFQVHLTTICSMIEVGSLTKAETLCHQILQEARQTFPRKHRFPRRALGLMASLRYWQRDFTDTQRLLTEALQSTTRCTGELNGDSLGVFTCGGLSIVHLIQGNIEESNAYSRLATEGGSRLGDHAWSTSFASDIASLKTDLEKRQEGSSLAGIQQEYRHVWKKLEAWTLNL